MLIPLLLLGCGPADPTAPPQAAEVANPAAESSISLDFQDDAVSITAPSVLDDWSVRFVMTAFGRDREPVSQAAPIQTGDRTEYVRDGVTEWYQRHPEGLEQGFDVAERPAGEGLLEVVMQVNSTLFPLFQEGRLSFLDEGQQVRLTYTGLATFDATGAEIDSWMAFDCTDTCELSLVVDDAEATYPITIDPLAFSNEVVLTTGVTDEFFGASVGLDGDLAIVGAYLNDDVATNAGRAYIYRRSGATWSFEQTLDAGGTSDRCGFSVAISPDRAAMGCDRGSHTSVNRPGAVHIFAFDGTTWNFEQELAAIVADPNERFGHVVDLDPAGDRLIVGAPAFGNNASSRWRIGTAHIFERSGTIWTETAQLEDLSGNANLRNLFGWSVGIEGDRAVVGAPFRDTLLSNVDFNDGAVFFFERSGGSWSQTQMIADADAGDRLGEGVAIDGDTAIAGRPFGDGGVPGGGAASIYVDSGGSWTLQATLAPTDALDTDRFGWDVEIEGDRVIVGARRDNSGFTTEAGSVLVYDRSGSTWTLQVEAFADDTSIADEVGRVVAVSGSWAMSGTHPLVGLEERAHLFQLTDCVAVTGQAGCDVDLVITELHPSPVNATEGQFIELYNQGLSPVQLSGATLTTDAGSVVVSHSVVVPGGQHRLIVESVDVLTNGGIGGIPLHRETGWSLDPNADTVVLTGTDASTLAEATYSGLASSGASLNLSYTGTYADPAVSFDLPTTTGSWCETWSPMFEGFNTYDFMTPGALNDDCASTLVLDYTYVQAGGSFGGTTTLVLDGTGLFTTGNSGEGVSTRTTSAAGQVLTFTYDVTGVEYVATPRVFGSTCFDGGFMEPTSLPAGFISGSWTNPLCP